MNYLDALKYMHATLAPGFYLEIGCRKGASLSLAKCPSLAVDPEPDIDRDLPRSTRIFQETSDAFFDRPDVPGLLGQVPDLAFIDGMHQVEFALRDFMNIEAVAGPGTVIAVDDVVPGDIRWASRERETQAWTGDVYRLIPILRTYRPDLRIEVFDATIATFGKGIAVISNLDPDNRVLRRAYDEIVAALEAGAFVEPSIEALRAGMQVRPASEFHGHIDQLADRAVPPLAARYLEVVKKSLLNEFYRDDEYRLFYLRQCLAGDAVFDRTAYLDPQGADPKTFALFMAHHHEGRPFRNDLDNLGFPKTMMGRPRLDNLHDCLDRIRRSAIPGDLIECGVWRGGGCIFMAAYLQAHDMTGRQLLVADSFEGLPPSTHEQDLRLDLTKEKFPQLAISLDTVRDNFAAFDLLDDGRQTFLKGWFRDTLAEAPTDRIALLRMDGDLYDSTMDILTALYDRVSPGGIVIVDDYGGLKMCRMAIEDFFAARGTSVPPITRIDWTGAFFVKPG